MRKLIRRFAYICGAAIIASSATVSANAQDTSLDAVTTQVAEPIATSEPTVTPEATTTAAEVAPTTAVTDPTLESLTTPLAVLPEISPLDQSTIKLTQTDAGNNQLSALVAAPGAGQSLLGELTFTRSHSTAAFFRGAICNYWGSGRSLWFCSSQYERPRL